MSDTTTTRPTAGVALRRWLAVDAVVTGGNAVAYLAFAGWLSEHLGSSAGLLRGIGVYLLVFTGLLVAAWATRSVGLAAAAVVGNVVWVLASVVVAALGLLDLTGLGRTWALLQALVVGALAFLQLRALREGARS